MNRLQLKEWLNRESGQDTTRRAHVHHIAAVATVLPISDRYTDLNWQQLVDRSSTWDSTAVGPTVMSNINVLSYSTDIPLPTLRGAYGDRHTHRIGTFEEHL